MAVLLPIGTRKGFFLVRSDGGRTWQVNRGLLEHPTRERWQPGAGGMCTHSIQPADGIMYVAISAAGTFRSEDGGGSWTPINKSVAAEFMPDPYPEVGQCVHKLLVHPKRPERLWQQNHCGVYRSDDRGDSWDRLDGNGLPTSFGFPLALDPEDPDVAYVIPEQSQEHHFTVGAALRGLPVRNLLFDEAGQLRRLINVYVDGVDARGGPLLEEPLTPTSEVRVVGAVAGG